MAIEQFSNNAQSSLTAALTSGATSFAVANALGFPSSGNFRVLIDGEILLVTAVSGNTFTVSRGQEGTTPAAHASGVYVTHVLTAGALLNCPRSMTTTGDLEYLASSGAVSRLGIGTSGQVLTVPCGRPCWHPAASGGGGIGTPTTKTANYTASPGDLVLCDASGGAFTITLPAASGNSGKTIAVKKTDTGGNAITVSRAGSDTISGLTSGGQTSFTVRAEGDCYWLVSDGTATWHVVDRVISPSYCATYQNSAQSIPGDGSDNAVLFDTNVNDADGLHSTSVNTSRITAKKAGKYLFTATVQWNGLGATHRNLALWKNGINTGTKLTLLNTQDAYAGSINAANGVVAQVDMANGDYVEVSVFQSSGGSVSLLTSNQSTSFQAQRTGD